MASPLDTFVKVGPRTTLFTPSKPRSGELIILCSWLAAAPKHVAKYAALYQKLLPETRILLIQSDIPVITSSYKRQCKEIEPAVNVVLDVLSECGMGPNSKDEVLGSTIGHHVESRSNGTAHNNSDPKTTIKAPKILLQTMSNGGTNSATHLLTVLRSRLNTPLPIVGLICDSGPNKGEFWRSHEALVLSLPKGNLVSNIIGVLFAYYIMIFLFTWIALGNENPASLYRHTLLSSDMVRPGWKEALTDGKTSDSKGRIKLLYSKADKMCHWEELSEYAEEARGKGWDVNEVVFEGSGHCAHFMSHPDKYAEAVKNMWDESRVN